MHLSPASLALVAAIFLLAGGVKGLIGMGLPTVALAMLVNTMPLRDGVTLIVIPAVITNIWQAFSGGRGIALVKRFWSFLLLLCIGTWIGVGILASSNQRLLSAIFGGVLALYALFGLIRPAPPPLGRSETWLSPVLGVINGLINGMTGSYVFPSVPYLEALRLGRDELIQALGIVFLVCSSVLGLSLTGHNVMSWSQAAVSAGALAPALAGYYIGQIYRRKLPEATFRRVFLIGLAFLGLYTVLTRLFF